MGRLRRCCRLSLRNEVDIIKLIFVTVARNEIRFSLNGIILLRNENALHLVGFLLGRFPQIDGRCVIDLTHVITPQGIIKKETRSEQHLGKVRPGALADISGKRFPQS